MRAYIQLAALAGQVLFLEAQCSNDILFSRIYRRASHAGTEKWSRPLGHMHTPLKNRLLATLSLAAATPRPRAGMEIHQGDRS